MDVKIEQSWKERLSAEFEKPYFSELTRFVRHEYSTTTCYPPGHLIFNAFNLCPFDKVKVVIIGQDPYHEQGQAQGLSFSVNDGVPFPPSLQNIFKEIEQDLGTPMPKSGDLTRWAEQGVLLLNATLTVRAHQAAQGMGDIHRCRHQGPQRRTRPPGLHSLGRLCTLQEEPHRHVTPPGARVGTPVAPLRKPRRMVRQPPFLTLQPVSGGAWGKGD